MTRKTRVIIESPFAGDSEANGAYARRCLLDSLLRDEAPLASHLLYTQVLDDRVTSERERGMYAGFAWSEVAEKVVVYVDLGVSSGMKEGIRTARSKNVPVEIRTLDREVEERDIVACGFEMSESVVQVVLKEVLDAPLELQAGSENTSRRASNDAPAAFDPYEYRRGMDAGCAGERS